MTAPAPFALSFEAAQHKLSAIALNGQDRQLFHNMLVAFNEAGDKHALDLTSAEARGLIRGLGYALAFPGETLAQILMLFEGLALHEFEQMAG